MENQIENKFKLQLINYMTNNKILIKLEEIAKQFTNKPKSNLFKINFAEDLDSLQMLDLVKKIEKVFKIKINQKDLNYKNFSNLRSLEKLLEKNDKNKKK